MQRKMEDVRLVNCAKCGAELLGESERAWYYRLSGHHRKQLPPPVRGRVFGRPYCAACLDPTKADRSSAAEEPPTIEEIDP